MGEVVPLFRHRRPDTAGESSAGDGCIPGNADDALDSAVLGPGAEAAYEHGCELESRAEREVRPDAIEALRAGAFLAYQQAVLRDPGHAGAQTNLGRLWHRSGRLDKAESCYRRAVRIDPEEPVYWFNLGVVLQDRGHASGALTAYRVTLVLDPGCRDAHFNMASLLDSAGDRLGAFRHLSAYRQLGGTTQARTS